MATAATTKAKFELVSFYALVQNYACGLSQSKDSHLERMYAPNLGCRVEVEKTYSEVWFGLSIQTHTHYIHFWCDATFIFIHRIYPIDPTTI